MHINYYCRVQNKEWANGQILLYIVGNGQFWSENGQWLTYFELLLLGLRCYISQLQAQHGSIILNKPHHLQCPADAPHDGPHVLCCWLTLTPESVELVQLFLPV